MFSNLLTALHAVPNMHTHTATGQCVGESPATPHFHPLVWRDSSVLFYSRLCPSTVGSSPKQESSNFALCYPCPNLSLLPHNVISPMTFWSSDWSYTLYLPLCASNSPSIIFHSSHVSNPFPFCIGYVLDYVCHSGSLSNDDVTDSVFSLTFSIFLSMAQRLVSSFCTNAFVRHHVWHLCHCW